MRLLLDSHAFLWFLNGDVALSTRAREAIEDPGNQVFVSSVSAWEIAIKVSLRKLTIGVGFTDLFPDAVIANGFQMTEPELAHYNLLIGLPWHHRDPFDRLLVVQALHGGFTFVTKDSEMNRYGVPTLW